MSNNIDMICELTGEPATLVCQICGMVAYKDEKCQAADWVNHEPHCNVEYQEDPSIGVAVPFDLVEVADDGREYPAECRVMMHYEDPRNKQGVTKVTCGVTPEADNSIDSRVGVARLRGKKDLGYGRAPTDAEDGEQIDVTVKFVDRKTGVESEDNYNLTLPLDALYKGSDESMTELLVSMRKRERLYGLVLWASLDRMGQKPMRITTDGTMTVTVKRANDDEFECTFRIRNILPLRFRPFRKAFRFASWFDKTFKTGVTGRRMLKAKKLNPTSKHFILNYHDQHISSGMQVNLVLRMEDGKFAELVDMEIYIPDNMPAEKDSQYDSNAEMNVSNSVVTDLKSYNGELDDVTAVCMALRDHLEYEKRDQEIFKGDRDIDKEIGLSVSKAEKALSVLSEYQENLEKNPELDINQAIGSAWSEANEMLEVGGKLRQMRWAKKISKRNGLGWAKDKFYEDWSIDVKKNKNKIRDLYNAVRKASVSGKTNKQDALDLMRDIKAALEEKNIYLSQTSFGTRAKKRFNRIFKRDKEED